MSSFSTASYDNDAYRSGGATLRVLGCQHPGKLDNDGLTNVFGISTPNNRDIVIESVLVHSSSHIFDPKKSYVGLIVYLKNGKNDFSLKNGHSQTGDIYIKQSEWIQENIKRKKKKRNYLHGRLFYSVFGCWKHKNLGFVGGGFSYHKGEWKFNSGTLNTINPGNNNDEYHNADRKLCDPEKKIIQIVLHHFYTNHKWLKMDSKERIPFENLKKLYPTSPQHDPSADEVEIHPARLFSGAIKSFNPERGYGFVAVLGFPQDIFFHHSALEQLSSATPSSLENTSVELSIYKCTSGWRAQRVIIIK